MMFIDDDHHEPSVAPNQAFDIDVRDLLAACANEAHRQAQTSVFIDETLGALLSCQTRAPATEGKGRSVAPELSRAIQQADLFRQELASLARALDLAVEFSKPGARIPIDRVLACTPLRAFQTRLLKSSGRNI